MPSELRIDPDAVSRLAAAARRIADDLTAGERVPCAAAPELVAVADAAGSAARRARDADRAAAGSFRTAGSTAVSATRSAAESAAGNAVGSAGGHGCGSAGEA